MSHDNEPSRNASFDRVGGFFLEKHDLSGVKPPKLRRVRPDEIDQFVLFEGKIQTVAESERQKRPQRKRTLKP